MEALPTCAHKPAFVAGRHAPHKRPNQGVERLSVDGGSLRPAPGHYLGGRSDVLRVVMEIWLNVPQRGQNVLI